MTTVIHVRDQKPGDVFIGRPSKYGNPFWLEKDASAARRRFVVACFVSWWEHPRRAALREAAMLELKDKRLVCYCKPHLCHGDVIAQYVNGVTGTSPCRPKTKLILSPRLKRWTAR